jgi:hypothetical protein
MKHSPERGRTAAVLFALVLWLASALPLPSAAGQAAQAAGQAPQAAAPSAAQAPLVRGTVAARLDFRVHSGLITIPVRVNGSTDLRMYLDTGMSAPVVVLFHKELVAELGLKGTQKVLMGGAGGEKPKPATLAPGATVELGSLRLTNQRLLVMDDSRDKSEWPVDGIIGKSLFDKYLTEIDYERSTVTFYDPAGAEIDPAAAAIPIDLAIGFPLIEGAVVLESGAKLPLRFVVDIGHRNALSLNEDPPKGVLPPKRTIKSIAGRGIQGVIPASIGRIKALELGGFSIADVPTAFLAPGTNAGVSRGTAAGNVGSLVWRRFKVLLDYPGKRMFLVPNSFYRKPVPFNMAGLVLEQDRDDVYFVRHVVEGSPAFAQGIKAGDRITAANGVDVRKYPYPKVLDIFNASGKKVKLTLERGGEVLKKTVKLRRLI